MTDVQRRFNSFEERLRQVQADITGLQRSHQNLQRSADGMRSEMSQRFDALDARFGTSLKPNSNAFAAKTRRRGAQPANRNALRSGKYSKPLRAAPPGCMGRRAASA